MSLPAVQLEVAQLSKRYGARRVIERLELRLRGGETLVVSGPNGAGKSTLLRLLSGLETPSHGTVCYIQQQRRLTPGEARPLLGLVTPELRLYRELTALEHLRLFRELRGLARDERMLLQLLDEVGLAGRESERVGGYSSGMALRLKYALMLLHQPVILLLDEPTATFDEQGRRFVAELVERQRERGITIIATNDPRELDLGDYLLSLGQTGDFA